VNDGMMENTFFGSKYIRLSFLDICLCVCICVLNDGYYLRIHSAILSLISHTEVVNSGGFNSTK